MKIPENVIDGLWSTAFGVIVIALGPGSMLLGALATNAVLGNPVDGSYHGTAAVLEFIGLFAGLFVGLFLACKLIGLLTRRFVDRLTYDRWQAKFTESLADMSGPLRSLMLFFNRLSSP